MFFSQTASQFKHSYACCAWYVQHCVNEGGVQYVLKIKKQRVLEVGHCEQALHVPIKSTDKLCFSDYGHFVISEEMGMEVVYLYVWCDF